MNRKFGMIIVLVLFLSLTSFGCNSLVSSSEVADDDIELQIKLNIKEDIGLLVVDYAENGIECGSGGVSNADRSLLKHDELIKHTLSKQEFDNPYDQKKLSIQFTIITEYVDPNYENIYPAEYTKPIDNAISLEANFGESYIITITGDKTNGYTATLDK